LLEIPNYETINDLKVNTYRDSKPKGRQINMPIEALAKRTKAKKG